MLYPPSAWAHPTPSAPPSTHAPGAAPSPQPAPASDHELAIPPEIQAAIWRGNELGRGITRVTPSGFDALDAQLPGGGWPCRALTEILVAQFSILEWRLLAPGLRAICATGKAVAVVAPPTLPHVPGLRHDGLADPSLVCIQAEAPAQRLWVLEELIKSNACGAIIAWLPQARQEQLRRLQVLAAGCDAPVFLCRPACAASDASAAPLRLQARAELDWALAVDIIKRKGPPLDGTLRLPSIPGGLKSIITPRLQQPSRLLTKEADDVVVCLAPAPRRQSSVPH